MSFPPVPIASSLSRNSRRFFQDVVVAYLTVFYLFWLVAVSFTVSKNNWLFRLGLNLRTLSKLHGPKGWIPRVL